MARSRVTLGDVARRAGVSTTTVSYVINGRGAQMRIAPDTERKVRRAITDLGFRPNHLARNLRTKQTKTIGVITDHVASGLYASQMLRGASAAAAERGYLLIIGETAGDLASERVLVEEFHDRHVDFTLVATMFTQELSLPAGLDPAATVFLNCVDPEGQVTCVVPDEYAGGRLAGEVLARSGVDREVWVLGDHEVSWAVAGPLRVQGLGDRLAEGGHTLAGIVECGWDVRPAFDAAAKWLAGAPRVTAVVALNDRIAMGAYQALAERGLFPGVDVAVVSFDGSELSTWLRPELTSITIPYDELGRRAVGALLDRGEGRPRVERVPMPLLEGHSVP